MIRTKDVFRRRCRPDSDRRVAAMEKEGKFSRRAKMPPFLLRRLIARLIARLPFMPRTWLPVELLPRGNLRSFAIAIRILYARM